MEKCQIIYVKCPYHEKEQKKESVVTWIIQTMVVVLSGAIMISVASPMTTEVPSVAPQLPPPELYTLKTQHADTTSKPWRGQQNVQRLKPILNRLLKRNTFLVICMHHVEEMSHPYQACAVANRKSRQSYLMLNPRIVGGDTHKKRFRVNSIACETPYMRHRHERVIIEWDTLDNSVMYAMFSGDTSIEIQNAIDEFQGPECCHDPKPTEAIIKRIDKPGT